MRPWLPALIRLDACGGDWPRYLEAVYQAFKDDFVLARAFFSGRVVAIKRHPVSDGKEATFWHLISEGADESTRTPDMRRCERIKWPRALIDNQGDAAVRVWANERKGDRRILLFIEEEDYLVVLADRKTYVVLWTAYCVPSGHRRRALLKEYEAYKNKKKLGSPP